MTTIRGEIRRNFRRGNSHMRNAITRIDAIEKIFHEAEYKSFRDKIDALMDLQIAVIKELDNLELQYELGKVT